MINHSGLLDELCKQWLDHVARKRHLDEVDQYIATTIKLISNSLDKLSENDLHKKISEYYVDDASVKANFIEMISDRNSESRVIPTIDLASASFRIRTIFGIVNIRFNKPVLQPSDCCKNDPLPEQHALAMVYAHRQEIAHREESGINNGLDHSQIYMCRLIEAQLISVKIILAKVFT